MKTWLRLLLVTVTVGGGFAGVAVAAQLLFSSEGHRPAYLLALVLFAFVTASGLVFVHNPRRTRLLFVALALQVPWFSSPLLAYQVVSGFAFNIALIDGGLKWSATWLGSKWEITFFQDLPWGAGVNLFAVLVLVLLWWSRKPPEPSASFDDPPQ